MANLPTFNQNQANNLDYGVDWTAWLAPESDTISQSTYAFTPADPALTLSLQSNNTTETIVWIAGGTNGTIYTVSNTITTAAGRIATESFQLNITPQ